MAKENVTKFFEALEKDEALGKKVSALAETYYTAVADLAKESGFDVTAGEVKDALTGDAPLDEEELSSVAGGYQTRRPDAKLGQWIGSTVLWRR